MNSLTELPLAAEPSPKPPESQANPGPLIWVVPASALSPYLDSRSFYSGQAASRIITVLESNGQWYPRNPAETDPTFRQVIPYVLTTNQSSGKYLLMTRVNKQAEQRLHGKRYIGVGGHIEKEDLLLAEKL